MAILCYVMLLTVNTRSAVFGCFCLLLLPACVSHPSPETIPALTPTTPGDLESQIVQYVDAQTALAADDFDDAKVALQQLLSIADATTSPLIRAIDDNTIESFKT